MPAGDVRRAGREGGGIAPQGCDLLVGADDLRAQTPSLADRAVLGAHRDLALRALADGVGATPAGGAAHLLEDLLTTPMAKHAVASTMPAGLLSRSTPATKITSQIAAALNHSHEPLT